jgi:hypothetical protein
MPRKKFTAERVTAFVGALILIILLVVGPEFTPGRPSRFNFSRLRNGMSPERVEKIMGKPTGTGWDYPYHGDRLASFSWDRDNERYDAIFHNGVLVDKGHFRYHTP